VTVRVTAGSQIVERKLEAELTRNAPTSVRCTVRGTVTLPRRPPRRAKVAVSIRGKDLKPLVLSAKRA
jgi:ribosomal protein L1